VATDPYHEENPSLGVLRGKTWWCSSPSTIHAHPVLQPSQPGTCCSDCVRTEMSMLRATTTPSNHTAPAAVLGRNSIRATALRQRRKHFVIRTPGLRARCILTSGLARSQTLLTTSSLTSSSLAVDSTLSPSPTLSGFCLPLSTKHCHPRRRIRRVPPGSINTKLPLTLTTGNRRESQLVSLCIHNEF